MALTMKRQKRKQIPDSTIFIEKKKRNEEWKHFSFRSATTDGIDCGDKQCYLEYRVIPDCYLILETNNTNCNIPCVMEGCDKELHHFIPCPLWNCEPITTSTTSTTTSTTTATTSTSTSTSTSTTTSRPDQPSQMSPLIYTSIVLNIFFVAIVLAYLIVKCRVQITTRLANYRAQRTLPTRTVPNPNEHFSVGSSDNESDHDESKPLLTHQAQASTRHGSIGQGQDNLALESNDSPRPSTSNWQDVSQAILGGDPIIQANNLPVPSSSTNWQDVSLVSSPSANSVENTAAMLNQIEVEPKKEKPIFMLMKSFKKK